MGPSCKYLALLDPRPCFDGLRRSFVEDGGNACASFLADLNMVLEAESGVPATQLGKALVFQCAMNDFISARNVVQSPFNFALRAWPAYLECVRKSDYFFQSVSSWCCAKWPRSM